MNTAREIRNIWDEIGRMKKRTAGSASGAIVAFLGLNDTPAAYAGAALKLVRVNAGTNALEFVAAVVGGDVTGPAASTDNALARFHLATGKIIQNSNAILDDAGLLLLAETANAKMTIGLTINQAANTNEILAFKQSNVNHGCTTYAETDTYYNTQIFLAATGGALISAFSEDYASCVIRGYFKTDNTTFATNWSAVIRLEAAKISAPGYGNCAANQNVVAIRASRNATIESVWMANEAGQTWQTGTLWINENANTKMTTGITINQNGADDEIAAFKSSDVAHGITTRTETDTFGTITKVSGATGGMLMSGYTEDVYGLFLQSFFTNDQTTWTTPAALTLAAFKKSGTNVGNAHADQVLVAVRTYYGGVYTNVWGVNASGNAWQTGSLGINTAVPTAWLHLPAGLNNHPPLKFTAGTALATPEVGSLEFHSSRLYVTNVTKRMALDRTSDVRTSTLTVENSTTETTMFTATIPANEMKAGNVFRVHTSGLMTTASAADIVTGRIKIGGVTLETITSAGSGALLDTPWHFQITMTLRSVGGSASLAMHVDLELDGTTESETIETIDTTSSCDITITVQWNNAKAGNILSVTQGFFEMKN